jgi:hypothetical protein
MSDDPPWRVKNEFMARHIAAETRLSAQWSNVRGLTAPLLGYAIAAANRAQVDQQKLRPAACFTCRRP